MYWFCTFSSTAAAAEFPRSSEANKKQENICIQASVVHVHKRNECSQESMQPMQGEYDSH